MTAHERLKDYFWLTIGALLVAAGIYFFKYPNHFTTGGVSGLSVILGAVLPVWTSGTYVLVMNGIFLVVGFLVLNKDFGVRTVYCSLLMSLAIRALEIFYPLTAPLTNQKFLELCYSIVFPAIGSAILFNRGGSTGGTDIAAMILKKYSNMNTGQALLVSDFCIAVSAFFFFGVETGLFSLFGLGLKAVMVDTVIESINLKKCMFIITKDPHAVCGFILKNLHRGATVWEAHGAYTDHQMYVIMTALNRAQAAKVRRYVKQVDPCGFTVITNTSDILGKGFREIA